MIFPHNAIANQIKPIATMSPVGKAETIGHAWQGGAPVAAVIAARPRMGLWLDRRMWSS
jgi:hypothetical protein